MSNPKVGQTFTENEFFKWSENNFYRTSTNDMSAEVINNSPFHLVLISYRPERSQLLSLDTQDIFPDFVLTTIISARLLPSSQEKSSTSKPSISLPILSLQPALTLLFSQRLMHNFTLLQEDLELKLWSELPTIISLLTITQLHSELATLAQSLLLRTTGALAITVSNLITLKF